MVKRQVFYSFHFDNDYWRTNQVRNIGTVEGNKPVSSNEWERVKRKRDDAIKKWISDQLEYRSCTIVLVGFQTATRPWVKYEIKKSWELGMGVVGIHIHKLKNNAGLPSFKGQNPFSQFTINKTTMDKIVKCYNPVPLGISKNVYAWFEKHLAYVAEEAIKIRNKYP